MTYALSQRLLNQTYYKVRQSYPLTLLLLQMVTGDGRRCTDQKLTISYRERAATETALQLLVILLIEYTHTNNPNMILPLDLFLEMRGLTDRREACRQLRKDLELLDSIAFTCSTKGECREARISGEKSGLAHNLGRVDTRAIIW